MTRASFTAPGANRSITFSDGKGRKNFCINKENGKIFSFSFHFPLIFLKKCTHTPVILFHTAPKQPRYSRTRAVEEFSFTYEKCRTPNGR